MTKSPSEIVLEEITEADRAVASLMTNHILNTSPGWRPSDAARAVVVAWRKHDGTFERLREQQVGFNTAVREGKAWA